QDAAISPACMFARPFLFFENGDFGGRVSLIQFVCESESDNACAYNDKIPVLPHRRVILTTKTLSPVAFAVTEPNAFALAFDFDFTPAGFGLFHNGRVSQCVLTLHKRAEPFHCSQQLRLFVE